VRVVLFSDLHLESGSVLGSPDPEYGNSRYRDAEKTLETIAAAAAGADALIFAGDMTKGPRPGPLAYRLFIEALQPACLDKPFWAVRGNHDFLVEASPVQVVGKALAQGEYALAAGAVTRPCVKVIGRSSTFPGLQIGFLPWSPPSRMFEKAPNDPAELMRLVGDTLADIANGLVQELDPDLPSILIGHWLAEGPLFTMPDVMRSGEPIIHAARLETGPWDAILFGHYHEHLQIGPRSWYIGAPMRSGFGEEDLQPGFVEVEWDDSITELDRRALANAQLVPPATAPKHIGTVRHVPLEDRSLITWDIDEDLGELGTEHVGPAVAGAIVRLRYECAPEQAAEKAARAADLVEQLYAAGALKVIGPKVEIISPEREARSELTVDVDPLTALDAWLEQAEVPEGLHDAVRAEARAIVGG